VISYVQRRASWTSMRENTQNPHVLEFTLGFHPRTDDFRVIFPSMGGVCEADTFVARTLMSRENGCVHHDRSGWKSHTTPKQHRCELDSGTVELKDR